MIKFAGFLLAAVMAAFFFWDRYRPKSLRIDIDLKNTIVTRFSAPNHRLDGHIAIVFYNLTVVNVSRSSCTLRDLHLRYKIGQIGNSTISHVLLTGQVYAPLEKKLVNAAVIRVGSANVVLMNWCNLRSRIAENAALEPGGAMSASALFLLDTDDFEILKDLKEVSLVLTDYRGRKSTHAVDIGRELIERGVNSVILNGNFKSDPNGDIVFI